MQAEDMTGPETRNISRVDQDGENEGTEGRGRAKRGKNGTKKLPQRGLGVAQLEKLRLQEQKMQETACFAATHGLHVPSFFTTLALAEKGNLYAQSYPYLQGKMDICNSLRGTHVPVSGASLMIAHVQDDSDTAPHSSLKDKSLPYSDLMSSSNLNQPSQSSLAFMFPAHRERYEPAPSGLGIAVDTSSLNSCLSSSISPREHCSGKSTSVQKENCKIGATEAEVKMFSFSTVDSPSASSKGAISKGCHDTGLLRQVHSVPCQFMAIGDGNVSGGQGIQNPFASLFPASESSKSKGLGYNDYLKGSVCLSETNGRGGLSNLQLLNSSFEPPDENRSSVYQLHLPVMGNSSFGNLPKELSSFQKFPSNYGRTPAEKSSERKRPWLATQIPASFELNLMDSSSSSLGGLNGHASNHCPKVQTSGTEAICPASGVLLSDLGDCAIPCLNINSSASISAPFCKESQMSLFARKFCTDPLLFLDVKKNGGSINGYSTLKVAPETACDATRSSTLLSLGPTNKSGYDFFVQTAGNGERSLQRDCREFQGMMSQKDAIAEWELNISFRKEQNDMPVHLSSTKGRLSAIKSNSISEALWPGEQGLPGGASQCLDLSLKLAL